MTPNKILSKKLMLVVMWLKKMLTILYMSFEKVESNNNRSILERLSRSSFLDKI